MDNQYKVDENKNNELLWILLFENKEKENCHLFCNCAFLFSAGDYPSAWADEPDLERVE